MITAISELAPISGFRLLAGTTSEEDSNLLNDYDGNDYSNLINALGLSIDGISDNLTTIISNQNDTLSKIESMSASSNLGEQIERIQSLENETRQSSMQVLISNDTGTPIPVIINSSTNDAVVKTQIQGIDEAVRIALETSLKSIIANALTNNIASEGSDTSLSLVDIIKNALTAQALPVTVENIWFDEFYSKYGQGGI
jgi:hypothetical protein